MSQKVEKGLPYFVLLGYVVWLSSFILPGDLLGNALGPIRWGGVTTLMICPIIGILGVIVALIFKKIPLVVLSSILIFSFFISWGLASF